MPFGTIGLAPTHAQTPNTTDLGKLFLSKSEASEPPLRGPLARRGTSARTPPYPDIAIAGVGVKSSSRDQLPKAVYFGG